MRMRAGAQKGACPIANLGKKQESSAMSITPRCNNAGPLGKPIATRSFVQMLRDCLPGFVRLRW
jgi:hypothetical protein